jgi:hypothetical protein
LAATSSPAEARWVIAGCMSRLGGIIAAKIRPGAGAARFL